MNLLTGNINEFRSDTDKCLVYASPDTGSGAIFVFLDIGMVCGLLSIGVCMVSFILIETYHYAQFQALLIPIDKGGPWTSR